MARLDPHSYADSDQPQVDSLTWRARVDFARRVLEGEATLTLRDPAPLAGPLDLDTRDLRIADVLGDDGQPLRWALAAPEPILGARLRVDLPAGARRLHLRYLTLPHASALQWLEPSQTAAGSHPFLYSQCQPIHARSVVPLPDTPRTRLRYEAEIVVPRPLRALMAAEQLAREERSEVAVERFRLLEPVAPYLFAFAVGHLAARDVGPRSRVWAEPPLVDRAAWEFAETERMLAAGEALFGPYRWGRYDLLILPPAFPYGGMENPRLTFLTPTVIAGDRSLASVVAHELAHSWTGNLVSNASAEHFWLNEGFTTYAERRIVEVLHGADVAALEWALGRRELDEAVRQFERDGRPELAQLRTTLAGVDPDQAYSVVPYEKGALFLLALEAAVGRPRFDGFLRRYLERFAFQAVTTEELAEFAARELPGALARVNADAWLFSPGVPVDAPRPRSGRLEAIERLHGEPPPHELASAWTPIEWQLFIGSVPRPAPLERLHALDQRYGLTAGRNCDVLAKWLDLALRSGYAPAVARVEEVLGEVGRLKYLKPLYRALAEQPETLALARSTLQRVGARYHPIARQVVQELLDQASALASDSPGPGALPA